MDFFEIITQLFSLDTITFIVLGTVGGIILGAIPGLSGPIGVAILLPITFGMSPANGLLMLGGIYMGATYGGAVSAIILNSPGTGEASCTALDGYPLTRKGRGLEALYFSIIASFVGGLFGVSALLFFTPVLADFALRFGPPEIFMLGFAGLTIVGSLSGAHLSKSFFAVALGILISLIGTDINTGQFRFTFEINELRAGINLIPIVVGFFAISEMVTLSKITSGSFVNSPLNPVRLLDVVAEVFRKIVLLIRSSVIGVLIGILPGTGGAVAAFVGYGDAKRISKSKDSFGKGNPEGIIAAEAANNAAVGGSLIPLLALGIPGSATAAILYGALTIHGLIPGPKLLTDYADVTYVFMAGMLLTVFVMLIVGLICTKLFTKVLKVNVSYIIPTVIVFSTIGVYSVRSSLFDILLMVFFGALGVLFKKLSIPTAPVILGCILGPMVEQNFRRTLQFSEISDESILIYLLSRPISAVLIVVVLALIYSNFNRFIRNK